MSDDQSTGMVISTANNEPRDDSAPAWYNLTLAVAPAGNMLTMWVRVKQVDRFPKCQTVYLGTLPAGDYKISVNDVEKQLRID